MTLIELTAKLWVLVGVLFSLLGVFIGWYHADIRRSRNEHHQRLLKLEGCSISNEEREKTEAKHEQRIERMHQENRESIHEVREMGEMHLLRIEAKMDAKEEKDSFSRHAIRNELHAVAMKVAVLEKQGQVGK